ncbi:MAG: CapA family protein, partial [Pseudomonadota bacterium]
MLRLICKLLAIVSTLVIATCQTTPAIEAEGWISGRVLDAEGRPLNATLEINGQAFNTDSQGRFAITPSEQLVYRIEVSANDYYPMRHTFSHAELTPDAALDDIVLVERRPGRTLFVFGGDAMIGRRFYQPFEGEPVLVSAGSVLEDSQALLAEMKPYLERADYASINLETPVFDTLPGEAAPKFVTFYSAPETLDALEWAGVDYVALGNNHIYDFLEPGLDVSIEHLKQSKLDFSGAGENEADALRASRFLRDSNAYDFLSYVGWPAGPPTQSAEADKGGAALGTLENLLSTTLASLENAGIPILQFHGGLEYVEEPTLAIETKLKQAVDEGAALVIGHHPHVVQGLELYNGRLIAWSLGNFLFDQYFYSAQSAALLYVWMDGDEFYHAEAVPVYIKGYHPTPAVGPMRNLINRRLFDLSAKRGTYLNRSGGHMILPRVQKSNALDP